MNRKLSSFVGRQTFYASPPLSNPKDQYETQISSAENRIDFLPLGKFIEFRKKETKLTQPTHIQKFLGNCVLSKRHSILCSDTPKIQIRKQSKKQTQKEKTKTNNNEGKKPSKQLQQRNSWNVVKKSSVRREPSQVKVKVKSLPKEKIVHEHILKPRKIQINFPFIQNQHKLLKNKKKSITIFTKTKPTAPQSQKPQLSHINLNWVINQISDTWPKRKKSFICNLQTKL